MRCNKCGNILPDDSAFCQYCGNKIEKEIKNKDTAINDKVEEGMDEVVMTEQTGVIEEPSLAKTKDLVNPVEVYLKSMDSNYKNGYTEKGKKVQTRHCNRCGSLVNNETKICSGCGKKYFNKIKFSKYFATVLLVLISLALLTSGVFNIVQYKEIEDLNRRIDYWKDRTGRLQRQVAELQSELFSKNALKYME